MQAMSDLIPIEILEWDSDFFEYKVGSLKIESNNFDIDKVQKAATKQNLELLYVVSDTKLQENSSNYDFQLVDQKVTYFRNLEDLQKESMSSNIVSFPNKAVTDRLIELSKIAGGYSRFKLDSKLPTSKFDELYSKWIVNSVSRKFADEVLVYQENDSEILGLITIKFKEQLGDIGLLSVLPDNHGKGIGSELMKSALSYIKNKGVNEATVVTQLNNIQACKFYEKNQFTIVSTKYIYHFWLS